MIGKTNAISVVSAPVPIIKTVSGSVISISDALAQAAESLDVDINAVQNLNGYDSPWPAGGGANKWDEVWEQGSIDNSTGEDKTASTGIRCKNYISVVAGESYYICNLDADNSIRYYYYDANHGFVSSAGVNNSVLTIPSGVSYMRIRSTGTYGNVYKNDWAVNYPATVTTYSPYANICPISGWSAVKVTRTGKNLLDSQIVHGIWANGVFYNHEGASSKYLTTKTKVLVAGGTDYVLSFVRDPDNPPSSVAFSSYAADGSVLQNSQSFNINTGKFTTSSGAVAITINIVLTTAITFASDVSVSDFQLELGSTATDYEPYNGNTYTIQLGQTVYGGTLNVTTGVLTVDRAIVDLGSLTWELRESGFYRSNAVTNMKTPASLGTAFNGIAEKYKIVAYTGQSTQDYSLSVNLSGRLFAGGGNSATGNLVYELATPQTVQLSPTTVQMLLGNNTIWSDSGDGELQYWARR